jgi:hypothetical protein
MGITRKGNATLAILGLDLAQPCQRKQPHGEIVEVLPVPVRHLADAKPAGTP